MVSRWFSAEEIAQYLGVAEDTIYRWIDRRRLPAHRVGKLWKFKTEEVDDWVKSGRADDARRPVGRNLGRRGGRQSGAPMPPEDHLRRP
ncbi:MAG TPA: transcriptional regulator [Elusimicrobia bacterium]|nr:transcriptional regulator [Elusimicrobiota bacterium]